MKTGIRYTLPQMSITKYNLSLSTLPFTDEMSVFAAKVTSEGDTSDPKHVLHYLPLVTSVVG